MSDENERKQPTIDRDKYLQEQIEKQKRGEPIDRAWVQSELARTRRVSRERLEANARRMRLSLLATAGVFCLLWLVRSAQTGNVMQAMVPAVIVCFLGVWALRRRS